MLRISLLKVKSPQLRFWGFFWFVVSFLGVYFSFLSAKNVLEPQLENRHTRLCVLSALPVTLVPAEGLRHYLKEGLA